VLVVGINSDRSTRANKGPRRPVQKEMERVAILSALPSVDYVTVFDELTPINLLRAVKPHILVKGGNYTADEVIGRDLVEQSGGRVVIIPYQGEVTTKSMIDSVKDASDGFRSE
jgi:rfaE bifunctional protein nucleotidyltransferase chain/domain